MLVNKLGHDETQDGNNEDDNYLCKPKIMRIQMGGFYLSDTREKIYIEEY